MNSPEYEIEKGTVFGEIRNEVFCRHGLDAYNTAMYGWHTEHVTDFVVKDYTLVNVSSSVQFLVATVTFHKKEFPQLDPITHVPVVGAKPMSIIPDHQAPQFISFEWKPANVPFEWKYDLDAKNVTYTL